MAPGAHHSDWYFGDTHSHSTYTSDFYFGDGIYTIPELKSAAKVAGLDWLVLIDHSYCLNTTEFNEQKSAVTSLSGSTFAFLFGEELSVAELVNGTKSSDTAHYNGVLNTSFVASQTDLFRKASSPGSQQGINYLKNPAAWRSSTTRTGEPGCSKPGTSRSTLILTPMGRPVSRFSTGPRTTRITALPPAGLISAS